MDHDDRVPHAASAASAPACQDVRGMRVWLALPRNDPRIDGWFSAHASDNTTLDVVPLHYHIPRSQSSEAHAAFGGCCVLQCGATPHTRTVIDLIILRSSWEVGSLCSNIRGLVAGAATPQHQIQCNESRRDTIDQECVAVIRT